MSFVPSFFNFLVDHLKTDERQRMLRSLVPTVAPELWLSLEAAALLDVYRDRFNLDELFDQPGLEIAPRSNVPRWLVAAERRKVDIWIEDLWGVEPSTAIEFKVIHNNKNMWTKVWEIRNDLIKSIPNASTDVPVERWGVVLLVTSYFYPDQSGNYSHYKFKEHDNLLSAFLSGIADPGPWYENAPCLRVAAPPVLIADMQGAYFIDSKSQQSNVYLVLLELDKS